MRYSPQQNLPGIDRSPVSSCPTQVTMPNPANSPLPGWLRPVARPAAFIYGRCAKWQQRRFDRAQPLCVPIPVVSVGNLSAGGTGKTPVVSYIATRLIADSHQPIIALRGYKARSNQQSDEAAEHAQRIPDAIMAVGPDRVAQITAAHKANLHCDVALLDDGFQHRRIHRNFDLVLIDATRSPLDDALLPLGYLREPISALDRADAIAITRADLVTDAVIDALKAALSHHTSTPVIAVFRSLWASLHSSLPGQPPLQVDDLANRPVVLLSGIANPDQFAATARAHASNIVHQTALPDHVRYTPATFKPIVHRARQADASILTTLKDWVKIRNLPAELRSQVEILYPQLHVEPIDPQPLWSAINAACFNQSEST